MSLLGKKRIQREEEADNVSHNLLILKNILFLQEYSQMFGIKEEEPPKEENNEEKIEGQKIENKEIRIVETTIILQKNEKIKQKIVKKENIKKNDKKTEQRHIISLIPISSSKTDSSKKKEDKKEISKDKKENNNTKSNTIFNSKPMDNPFSVLIGNKNDETKENKTNVNNTNAISNNDNDNDNNNNTGNPFTLFGNANSENKNENNNKSLFGNTFIKDEKSDSNNFSLFANNTPLFSLNNNNNSNSNNKSLFSQNEGKSLFSGNDGKSLFSGGATSPFLFSNNNANPFSQIKGDSFLNSLKNNTNNKNENNKNTKAVSLFDDNLENYDDGEDDERDKPKTKYVSEPLKAQDYSEYTKLYNAHLNNLFLYNKNEKKYISKGNGFFSIEKTKDEKNQKHQAVVVYRNQTGNKLVEGFIDKQFDKIDIYSKNFNYVVCLGIVRIVEGKPELGSIKIPFHNEEDANALKEAFNNAITFLKEK